MRFLLFNISVIAALVYLISGSTGNLSSDLQARASQTINAVMNTVAPVSEIAALEATQSTAKTAAQPLEEPAIPVEQTVAQFAPEAQTKVPQGELEQTATIEKKSEGTSATQAKSTQVASAPPPLPPARNVAVASVRHPDRLDDTPSTVAESHTFMSTAERRRELQNLARDMEGYFLDSQ